MSVCRVPPLPVEQHDPNAGLQGPWTIEFPLDPGWELIGPATVIAVAADGTDDPLVGDTLVISSVTIGQITETPNVWGISFDTEGGATQMYWLRGAAQRTDGTSTYGVHRTVRMPSGNN
jgi:hypothetical protein